MVVHSAFLLCGIDGSWVVLLGGNKSILWRFKVSRNNCLQYLSREKKIFYKKSIKRIRYREPLTLDNDRI